MKIQEAEKIALQEIKKYCPEFRFQFDRAVRRFGCCHHNLKLITLSKALTELNSLEQVKDTILHEIAHAMAGIGHGHDQYWKSICRQIGATPERCYKLSEVVQPIKQYRYLAVCEHCGHHSYKMRKPRSTYSCGHCCRKFNPDYILHYHML